MIKRSLFSKYQGILYTFILLVSVALFALLKYSQILLWLIIAFSIAELIIAIIFNQKWWAFSSVLLIGITTSITLNLIHTSKFELSYLIKAISGILGISWLVCFGIFAIRWKYLIWWALLPGGTFLGLHIAFILQKTGFLDYVFFLGIGVGFTLLIWGIGARYLGLLIAGSIVLTTAPGITSPWGMSVLENTLAQTGAMLVWFGLGWVIITISSRVIRDKFILWPLISGGVLEIVGIGLFLGANPTYAGGVLSNPTLMSIILFGGYIFFQRLKFRK